MASSNLPIYFSESSAFYRKDGSGFENKSKAFAILGSETIGMKLEGFIKALMASLEVLIASSHSWMTSSNLT
jgi:hypothetical protein